MAMPMLICACARAISELFHCFRNGVVCYVCADLNIRVVPTRCVRCTIYIVFEAFRQNDER